LDRGTSGVLLFAFDAAITRDLSAQFEQNAVHKRYLAIVRGWPPEAGTIDHALTPDRDAYGKRSPNAQT
jgi:tRNA pseudouridine65 synthase